MSKFPGVPERIVSRLRAQGYWKRGKPEVRRFSQEHGYRWQYVYEWIRGRVPGPDNLSRLARDLGVTEAWLLRESERRRASAEGLAAVGRLVARASDPEEVAQQVAESLRGLLGAGWSNLFRLDRDSGDLVCVASSGPPGTRFELGVVMPAGEGAVGLAIRGRSPIVTDNALTDPRLAIEPEMRARIEGTSWRSVLAIPLIVKDRILGAMGVGDEAGRIFHPEDVRLAQAVADHAAVALDNARPFRNPPPAQRP
ncbi:MAG TPA: GAF domain-containing protein [Candidatus Limnocylindrales bacterium]|nr:GAF domain-containing protein [Candidatus Limnocylindrales bacterium]